MITNDEILDLIGETVYKWNYDAKDGKFQKLSNICGYTLARLWAPYVLTRNNSMSKRLLVLCYILNLISTKLIIINIKGSYIQFNNNFNF